MYKNKYLKYKNKYLHLKTFLGGSSAEDPPVEDAPAEEPTTIESQLAKLKDGTLKLKLIEIKPNALGKLEESDGVYIDNILNKNISGIDIETKISEDIEKPEFIKEILEAEIFLNYIKKNNYQKLISKNEQEYKEVVQQAEIEREQDGEISPATQNNKSILRNLINKCKKNIKKIEARQKIILLDLTHDGADKKKKLLAAIENIKEITGSNRNGIKEMLYSKIYVFKEAPLLVVQSFNNNIVLMGSAGSGKTFIAKKMAGLYSALGILLDSKVQEKTRGDIVAPFVGQTAIKVKQLLINSLESVLFIDEVYSIAGCPDPDTKQFDPYGEEAITEIVAFMSNYMGLLSVIVAGYYHQVVDCFFENNEGLVRRFPNQYLLTNYTDQDLVNLYKGETKKSEKSINNLISSIDKVTTDTKTNMYAELQEQDQHIETEIITKIKEVFTIKKEKLKMEENKLELIYYLIEYFNKLNLFKNQAGDILNLYSMIQTEKILIEALGAKFDYNAILNVFKKYGIAKQQIIKKNS